MTSLTTPSAQVIDCLNCFGTIEDNCSAITGCFRSTLGTYTSAMTSPGSPPSASAASRPESRSVENPSPAAPQAESSQPIRNFFTLAIYQVSMRVGWIFKTESIIMPAAMDVIGGAGWLRGCLPVFNRFGQSVPPLIASRRIKILRRKKWALFTCSSLMSVSFLGMSVMWFITAGTKHWWLPAAFLFFYALFFASTGVNMLSFGTLQGKLVQATWRGRLLLLSNILGAICAITAAALLLPLWLREEGGDFATVFGFSGACFAVSAVISLLLSEPADDYQQPKKPLLHLFGSAWTTLRDDANFRRLGIVAALFGSSMMLFPHYQALGKLKDGFSFGTLIVWVIAQNAGTAAFSLPAGSLADARGNRLVLRLAMLGIVFAPAAAILLANAAAVDVSMYAAVFVLIGLTPVTIKVFNNYTLEISKPEDHPRYLSTLILCMSAPIVVLSPLVGWLVDAVGFQVVFPCIGSLVAIGWLLTLGLEEPRHYPVESSELPIDING